MEKIKPILITVMKVLFFVLGIFILHVLIISNLNSINYGASLSYSYSSFIHDLFYSIVSFGFFLSLYFINFYFLQKIIKKENIIINWKYYKYLNITIYIMIMFSLVLLLFLGNNIEIDITDGLSKFFANIIMIILIIIIYLPFYKVFNIINSLEKLYKKNIKTISQQVIIKKMSIIRIFVIIIIGLLLFIPIKIDKRKAMCNEVYRQEEWTTSLIYLIDVYNEKQSCKEDQERTDRCMDGGKDIGSCTIKGKPVIYLYPQEKQDIKVQLDYKGTIFADYPAYDKSIKGWEVTAYPDGKIINHKDNKEYSYLFWEGIEMKIDWNLSKGFVVKGEDSRDFLQDKLPKLGLTPKEYNEFIVYWYPLMQKNKYNLVHFAGEQYTDTANLTITPKPDSILRVFMVFKALDSKIDIEEQKIKTFDRKGFTVVEWGGTEVK